MFVSRRFLVLFAAIFLPVLTFAQVIHGDVYDAENKQPLANVSIQNIYTFFTVTSDTSGNFIIGAQNGQLLEFYKAGYKTTRVRMPTGYMPSYFKIAMQKGFKPLTDTGRRDAYAQYRLDSARTHDMFGIESDHYRMSGFDMMASPFTAFSHKTKELERFQDDFETTEKEKYVDKIFNEELVGGFTGLKGDSLHYFMRRYRPTFEQLRNMNDYTYFNYIKQSSKTYRHPNRPNGAQ